MDLRRLALPLLTAAGVLLVLGLSLWALELFGGNDASAARLRPILMGASSPAGEADPAATSTIGRSDPPAGATSTAGTFGRELPAGTLGRELVESPVETRHSPAGYGSGEALGAQPSPTSGPPATSRPSTTGAGGSATSTTPTVAAPAPTAPAPTAPAPAQSSPSTMRSGTTMKSPGAPVPPQAPTTAVRHQSPGGSGGDGDGAMQGTGGRAGKGG
jgi:hypothetical protein